MYDYSVYDYEGHPYISAIEVKDEKKILYVYGNGEDMSDSIYITNNLKDVMEEYESRLIYGQSEWIDRLEDKYLIIDDEIFRKELVKAITTYPGSTDRNFKYSKRTTMPNNYSDRLYNIRVDIKSRQFKNTLNSR